MYKNVASQKFIVYAFDITTGAPKTGDAANLTAYVSKDYGTVTVLGDTSAMEMDATNAPGSYMFDGTQAETNADCLHVTGKSSTSNIRIVPQTIYTLPASFTSFVTPDNTSITAIKAKTDSLTFSVANKVDSNIKAVKDTAVASGVGTAASPWGP